uniref:Uncharacterized protein n=1 Tax=Prolemur simus TaxID=1328070 RepID=A0A8C9DDJ3_PROSS
VADTCCSLQLLASSDPPASAPQSARTTGVSHCAQLTGWFSLLTGHESESSGLLCLSDPAGFRVPLEILALNWPESALEPPPRPPRVSV